MSDTQTRPLPEKYRLARNIHEGYEVRLTNNEDGSQLWERVEHRLYVLAPVKVVRFRLANGETHPIHPDDEVMSRRLAAAPVAGGSA